MAFYHVGGCDCPMGCCDCGEEEVFNGCFFYDPIKNEIIEFNTALILKEGEMIEPNGVFNYLNYPIMFVGNAN